MARSTAEKDRQDGVGRRRRRLYQSTLFEAHTEALYVVVVGQLAKDAALHNLPPSETAVAAGRASMAKTESAWRSEPVRLAVGSKWSARPTARTSTKTYKTFLATYTPAGGVIRVVLVKEEHGWYAFYCTDPSASAQEVVEAFADRATIEQDFHDVKEVWGSGQQQVRNIWNNLAVYNLNLWMHTLVELWAWDRTAERLVDRSDSPWDDPERRPWHANRPKALQAQDLLRSQLLRITAHWSLPPEKYSGLLKTSSP